LGAALCANGLGLRNTGRRLDAARRCQQALSTGLNHADAQHLVKLLSFDGRYDRDAARDYAQVLNCIRAEIVAFESLHSAATKNRAM